MLENSACYAIVRTVGSSRRKQKKKEKKKKEGKNKKKKKRGQDPETRSEIRVLRDRDGYRCDNFRGELLPVKSEDGREGGKAKVEKNEYAE